MISYRTKRSHARSRINRIFPRVVFLERKLGVSIFSSLFMWGGISPVESDFEWQYQRKNYFKNGFSFACSHLPSRKFIWLEDVLFSFLVSCIDQELFCFSFDPFPFFSFHFFLSDLWLGIWVLAFVIRSPLRRFCCPFLWGKGWGFFSWAKVQNSLRLCLNMVFSSCEHDFDIWGKTNSCVKVSVSGWISILFPRGTRNNDDLETTCKISHGYS